MARIWQDGFEFNTTTAATATYDTVTNVVIGTTHVLSGTYAAQIKSLVSGTARGANKKFQAAASSVTFFRAYLYVVTVPSAANTIMAQTASSSLNSTVRSSIALLNNGTLILQGATNAQIGSASAAVNDSAWHMLELKMDTTPATGSRVIEARLDGVVFATSSAQTTGTQSDIFVGGNGLGEAQTVGEWWFDDLALNDNSGTSQTGYPGSGKIIQLYPNAAGDANGFLVQVGGTAGSANNYTRVKEIPPDDATSYNASAVLNAQDLFNVTNSGIGASDTVNTVLVGIRIANITGASATTAIEPQIEKTSGGTITNGTAILPDTVSWNTNGTASPRNYQLVTYKDPDGTAWTQPTLDSMQIGYEITATLTDAIGVTNLWASVDYTPSSPVNASVTQVAGTVTAAGGTQTLAIAISQSAATVTASGGTQTIATVNIASIAQVAATVTASGGTQSIASVNIVSIGQIAAIVTAGVGIPLAQTIASTVQIASSVTASGGTQVAASINIVAVTQVAATITASGGTQTVTTTNIVAISQSAATVTASGGTQAISAGSVINASVAQVAASVTATGGAQVIATIQDVAISQVGASVTAAGGTQTAATVNIVAISQTAATVTVTGGTQAIAPVDIVAISQTAATVTASGGTQSVAAVGIAAISQTAASIIVSGGVQSIMAVSIQSINVIQIAASIIASGGTQGLIAIILKPLIPYRTYPMPHTVLGPRTYLTSGRRYTGPRQTSTPNRSS